MKYTVEHIRDGKVIGSNEYVGHEHVLMAGDAVVVDATIPFIGTLAGQLGPSDLRGPMMMAAFPTPLNFLPGDVMKVIL